MTFVEAIHGAEKAGQRGAELRARVEAAYMHLLGEPEGAARELLSIAELAVPTFEALEDHRSLARTWLLIGYVRGGIHGDHAAWQEAEEQALTYYRRTAFPAATCIGQIAAALYWGPTRVPTAIERCGELIADEAVGHLGVQLRFRSSAVSMPRRAISRTPENCSRKRSTHTTSSVIRRQRRSIAGLCGRISSSWLETLTPLNERCVTSASTWSACRTGHTWRSGRPSSPKPSTGKIGRKRPSAGRSSPVPTQQAMIRAFS